VSLIKVPKPGDAKVPVKQQQYSKITNYCHCQSTIRPSAPYITRFHKELGDVSTASGRRLDKKITTFLDEPESYKMMSVLSVSFLWQQWQVD
jgi:hypothetical protein